MVVADEPAASSELAAESAPPRTGINPLAILRRLARGLASGAEWLFGLISLMLGLSMLAALPLVQFLSLGYFLESSARWRGLGGCATA